MPLSPKRSIAYLLLITALLLFAYCLRFVFHPMTDNSLLAISMMTLRWIIQVTLTQQELLDMMIASYKLSAHKIKAPWKLRIICQKRDGFSLNKIGTHVY